MNLFIESATIFLLFSRFILSESLLPFPFLPLQRLLLVFEILNHERQTTIPHQVWITDEEEGDLELRHLAELDLVESPGADEVPLSLDIHGLIRNSCPSFIFRVSRTLHAAVCSSWLVFFYRISAKAV